MIEGKPHYPITAKINEKGHLEIGGCDSVALAAEFGTPLYVLDEATIRERSREYKQALRVRYPNSEIIYASKALCTTAVLKIIESEGLGFDVSSSGELYTALKAQCNPKKIYFHGNNKSKKEIEEGLEVRISRFVVDNFNELEILDEVAKKKGVRADILIRVNPGIEAHTHEYIQTGRIDSKFGIGISEVLSAVKLADSKKFIEFRGLHAHIGSQIMDIKPFLLEAEVLLSLSKEIFDAHEFEVSEIDLGGGLGISYTGEESPAIQSFAETISQKIIEKAKEYEISEPKLILEPGRSIIGNAGVTLYTIGGIKDIPQIRKYAFIDGGMGDNPRPMLYQAKYDAAIGGRVTEEGTEVYTIGGRFCESGDILIKDIKLGKLEVGDTLVVFCTGAYNYSMASNYNRVPRPAMVLVGNGDANLIVKRETAEDLVMNDVLI